MKPATIRRFDLFYLAWVVLTIVDFFLQRDAYVAQVDAAATNGGIVLGSSFVTIVFVIWLLVMLLLWWLVSARRSAIAKWVIVVLVLLSVFGVPNLFRHALTATAIVEVIMLLVSVAAAYSLFGAEARAWFTGTAPAAPSEDDGAA